MEQPDQMEVLKLWIQRNAFPSRAIALLMGIGFLDLIVTALLHANGLIVELNPLMKPVIETSEWLFAFVKGSTLVGAWWVMLRYTHSHLPFIRKACLIGSGAYAFIWLTWFISAL